MYFSFIQQYRIVPEEVEASEAKRIGRQKHLFFPVPENDITEVLNTFPLFPSELKIFYQKIGFGFLHRRKGERNLLLDPASLINTNLRLGYYQEDPFIKEYFEYINPEKALLFFRTHSGQYLSISCTEEQGENAVFYKKMKIEPSLYDFLYNYFYDSNCMKHYMDKLTKAEEKEAKDANRSKSRKKVKYLGGHELLDPY